MTRQEFEYYIPSAVMPNDELFDRIADCLEQGEREAARLLGCTEVELWTVVA